MACGGRRRRFTHHDGDPEGATCSQGHFVASYFASLVALNAAMKKVMPGLLRMYSAERSPLAKKVFPDGSPWPAPPK